MEGENIVTKKCKRCGIEKPMSDFKDHRETKDKKYGDCRICTNEKQRIKRASGDVKYWDCKKYEKTQNGFIMRMYRNMKSRVSGVQKKKFHLYEGRELLAKEVFYDWIKSQPEFNELFERYRQSGFDRKLAPSVDRVDSKKGYLTENMELVTHSENSARSSRNRIKKHANDTYGN